MFCYLLKVFSPNLEGSTISTLRAHPSKDPSFKVFKHFCALSSLLNLAKPQLFPLIQRALKISLNIFFGINRNFGPDFFLQINKAILS